MQISSCGITGWFRLLKLVRFLDSADLIKRSGGQILKNIAQKAMNMEGDAGLRFYVFDDIADEKAFKTTYRSAMDTLPIDQAMADRIVEEANHAFHLNMNMFKELEGNLVAAIGKVLFGFLTRRQRAGSTEAVAA